MAVFGSKAFLGENRRLTSRLLNNNQAQLAQDAYLFDGSVKAYKGLETKYTLLSAGVKKSIYRWGANLGAPSSGFWFESANDIDYVKGPIAGDSSERTYFSGEDYPRVTDATIATGAAPYPTVSYRLGLPAPASAPTFVVNGVASGDPGLNESRYYVITYVSVFGEEGPPSVPTAIVEMGSPQTVSLNDIPGAPVGDYNVQFVRIYRTNTANLGVAAFQYVGEVAIGTATFLDDVEGVALGEELPSTDWLQPPATMKGIIGIHDGMLAGFDGNEIIISEPFIPSAYPPKYRQAADSDIVGLGHFDQTIVVCTEGNPQLITGYHPSSMSMLTIENGQSCVSKRGIVSLSGRGVIYPSPDGLMWIGQDGHRLITEEVISQREWAALKPETIFAFEHDWKYYAFYDTGTVQKGFIFDTRTPSAGFVTLDMYPDAGYRDPLTDTLYLLFANNIQAFDSDAANLRTYTWKSKEFVSPAPINPAFAQVLAETYTDITFKLYADGALKHTETVSSREPFSLPSQYLGTVFEIEITGTDQVYEFVAATSADELQDVT